MERSPDPSPPPPTPQQQEESAPSFPRRPDESCCELCGFPLRLEHHCKIVCPNCGFTRDCSDP